jgi:transcriptional regulator with XRE-family HTH domain
MNFNQAFDNMMRRFGYTGRQLARVAQLSEQTVSEFRNSKKPVTTKNLEQLLFNNVVSDEARNYFFAQLGASATVSARDLIEDMDAIQLAHLLNAIAFKISKETHDSTAKENMESVLPLGFTTPPEHSACLDQVVV